MKRKHVNRMAWFDEGEVMSYPSSALKDIAALAFTIAVVVFGCSIL